MSRLFSLLLLLIPIAVTGQELTFFGGPGFARMSANQMFDGMGTVNTKSIVGFHAGAWVDWEFKKSMGIQSGLMCQMKGFRSVYREEYQGSSAKLIYKLQLSYLELPLLFRYRIPVEDKIKISLMAGPVLGIGLTGKISEKVKLKENGVKETEKDHEQIRFGGSGHLKRADFGLMMGAGLHIKNVYVGFFYNQGLVNISHYSEEGYRLRNKVFGLSAGYTLKLGEK